MSRKVITGVLCVSLAVVVTMSEAGASRSSAKSATARASVVIDRGVSVRKNTDLSFGRFQNDQKDQKKRSGTVTVSSAPPVRVSSTNVQYAGKKGAGATPAIFAIQGDVNRAYVAGVSGIVVSIPGGYPLSLFTLWSQNSGDITHSAGHFSAAGNDTLRVGATITVPPQTHLARYGAIVPVTVAYQ